MSANDNVLCILDARINEVYSAVYQYEDELALLREGPWACAPADLALDKSGPLTVVGDGCRFLEQFPEALRVTGRCNAYRYRAYGKRYHSSCTGQIPKWRDSVSMASTARLCA